MRFLFADRPRKLIGALLTVKLLASPCFAVSLPETIDQVVKQYKIPEQALSLVVQAIDQDEPAINLNATAARNPASTIKLLTTFVALDVLGPTYRWPTHLYVDGPVKDGVIEGDLVLKGHGDPFLVVEEFWKMLGELRARGVHRIRGDLVIDDSHFAVPASDPGAFDQQPLRLYNVVPSAAIVNFNAIEFQFSQAGDGRHVRVRMHPEIPNLNIINNLKVKKGKCRGYNYGISMSRSKPFELNNTVIFDGAFPSACRSHSMHRSVMSTEAYAFGTFQRLWRHWGGTIDGTYRNGSAPARRPFVVKRSRPLAEIIRPLNKWSNNVMTRLLLYSLAEAKFEPPYTKEQGIEVMRDYLSRNGLDHSGLVVDNGSGLSRNTRVSAKFMTDLLRHAHRSRFMPEFIASLSISGLDGTVRRRFRGRDEAGQMHLKTGRLDGVAGIAGYVKARSGKDYTVALMINHGNIHKGAGIEIQNAVLRWAYRQ